MPPLLLDTNIISHLMRDETGALAARLAHARDAGQPVATSIIVECELLFGLARNPSARLRRRYDTVIQSIDILPLTPEVAPHYAQTRAHLVQRGTPIGPNDTFLAAHALALDAVLVTDNEAEFRRVPGLQVENWLRPAD